MTTTAFDESPPGKDTAAVTEHADRLPPEERGRLTIDDRVVEKVAGHAVTFVADAAAAPRRVLGVNLGRARSHDAASVEAKVHGDIASIEVAIAVRWPCSVRNVADDLRARIRSDVRAITGVRVDHVEVEVVSMTPPDASERKVL